MVCLVLGVTVVPVLLIGLAAFFWVAAPVSDRVQQPTVNESVEAVKPAHRHGDENLVVGLDDRVAVGAGAEQADHPVDVGGVDDCDAEVVAPHLALQAAGAAAGDNLAVGAD